MFVVTLKHVSWISHREDANVTQIQTSSTEAVSLLRPVKTPCCGRQGTQLKPDKSPPHRTLSQGKVTEIIAVSNDTCTLSYLDLCSFEFKIQARVRHGISINFYLSDMFRCQRRFGKRGRAMDTSAESLLQLCE